MVLEILQEISEHHEKMKGMSKNILYLYTEIYST